MFLPMLAEEARVPGGGVSHEAVPVTDRQLSDGWSGNASRTQRRFWPGHAKLVTRLLATDTGLVNQLASTLSTTTAGTTNVATFLAWSSVFTDIHERRRSHGLRDGSGFNACRGALGPTTSAHVVGPRRAKALSRREPRAY